MTNLDPALMLQALLATHGEANQYLRDTSRRIEEHVKFYLTAGTAVLGAMILPFALSLTGLVSKLVIMIGTGIIFVIGVIVFLRLVQIKVQATQHTAWGKGIEYSVYWVAFKGKPFINLPELPESSNSPFSGQVVLLLTVFGVGNSLALWGSVGMLAIVLSELLGFNTSTLSLVVYVFLSFVVSLLSAVFHRKHLNSKCAEALEKYEEVLKACLHIPPELITKDLSVIETAPVI